MFAIGDSKTAGDAWVSLLVAGLSSNTTNIWSEITPRFGTAGHLIQQARDYLDANLSAVVGTATNVVINVGANDVGALTSEAVAKGNFVAMIDAVLAKWPACHVYVALVWRRGYATACNTLATWITDVIATYSNGQVHVGMDERIWLENGDDGTTYTTDGTHYTDPAQAVCAAAWLAAMGY